jgi:glycerophosphoryl diester phosphodiesterase
MSHAPGAVEELEQGTGPVFIAHRMGNTPDLLRRAEAGGADVVEADVFLHRGRLEVRHSKTLGPVPVLWDRWSLAPGWGPRFLLSDLLESADQGTLLMIDLKRDAPGLSATLAGAMRDLAPGRPYLVCSQVWSAVAPFERETVAKPVYSIGSAPALQRFREQEHGQEGWISIHERLVTPGTAPMLRDSAAFVMSWPVNSERRIEELLKLGVRGMITDRLELIPARR